MLEVVVALAPQFAPAWAALAQFRVEAFRGIALDSVQLSVKRADVVAAANRALELDPGEGLVHVTLAHLLPWGDYRGREAAFDRAIKATDGLTAARTEMGWFLTSAGRNEEALRITAEGCKLDPFNARVANLYSQMLCATGRYNESIQAFVGFRRRWPDLFIFVNVPLLLAASVGDWPEADRLIEIAQRHHGTIRYLPDTLRRVAALREPSRLRRERILELLHKQVAATRAIDLAFLTLAHQMGLVEETFDLIEEASFDQINSEGGPAPAYSFSPGIIFDRTTNLSLIEDPRFVRLCDKLGLCDYWIESGHWPDCARFVPYNFKGEARRQVQQRS